MRRRATENRQADGGDDHADVLDARVGEETLVIALADEKRARHADRDEAEKEEHRLSEREVAGGQAHLVEAQDRVEAGRQQRPGQQRGGRGVGGDHIRAVPARRARA